MRSLVQTDDFDFVIIYKNSNNLNNTTVNIIEDVIPI